MEVIFRQHRRLVAGTFSLVNASSVSSRVIYLLVESGILYCIFWVRPLVLYHESCMFTDNSGVCRCPQSQLCVAIIGGPQSITQWNYLAGYLHTGLGQFDPFRFPFSLVSRGRHHSLRFIS